MNKSELLKEISEASNVSLAIVANIFDVTFDIISKKVLQCNEKIELRNFGVFYIGENKERIRINPKTKEKILKPGCKVIKFKASDKLKIEV